MPFACEDALTGMGAAVVENQVATFHRSQAYMGILRARALRMRSR